MAVAFLNFLKPWLLVYSMLKYIFVLLTHSIQHFLSCIHHFRERKTVSNESSPSTLLSPVYQEKSSVPCSTVKHTKVLILGGGMAGVTAAYTLQSNGMEDFLLLEASDRLGGRIKNSTFCGHTIEEGANWIHGVNKGHNPILQLAHDCGLKLFYYNDDSLTARNSDGKNVTEGVKKAIADLHKADSRMDDIIDDRGLAGGPPPPDGHLKPKGPLPDCSVAVAERELVGWKASSPEQVTAEYFVHDWDDGIPPSKASLLGDQLYLTDDVFGQTDAMVVDSKHGGYSSIVNRLAEQTFDDEDPRLLLGETVREVQLDDEDYQRLPDSSTANDSERICVRTASGHEYRAQYCIITFSNSVLLSDNVRFIPSLPDWKQRALKQSQMGDYTKIFLKFADNVRPFWDPTQWIMYVDSEKANECTTASAAPAQLSDGVPEVEDEAKAVSDNTDQYRTTSAAMQNAIKLGARFTRGYYSGWVNVSVDGIFPGSNMLLVMLVDDEGRAAERKTDAQIKSEVTGVLRRMYGKDVPEPEAIHCSKWSTNPLTLGSYPVLNYGTTLADLKNLTRPVDNLHFAGDGTSVEFMGCVQQAYISGVHEARKILDDLTAPRVKISSATSETSITMNAC